MASSLTHRKVLKSLLKGQRKSTAITEKAFAHGLPPKAVKDEGSCLLGLLSFRSDSALAQLYGTSATLEHHHFNHAVMILQSEVRPAPLLSLTEGQLRGPHSLMCSSAEKWDPMFTLNSDPGALRGPIPCQRPCSRSSPAAFTWLCRRFCRFCRCRITYGVPGGGCLLPEHHHLVFLEGCSLGLWQSDPTFHSVEPNTMQRDGRTGRAKLW